MVEIKQSEKSRRNDENVLIFRLLFTYEIDQCLLIMND